MRAQFRDRAPTPARLEPYVGAAVDARRGARDKLEWLRRYRPHVFPNRATHAYYERQVDQDPAAASAVLDAVYVQDEAHRRAKSGPYARELQERDARADAAPNVTGIIATGEVSIDGRVELRTRATLERIARQIERDRTPVVLDSHADDAPVVGTVVSAWVVRDVLHADMAVSDAAARAVASGTDAASMKYTCAKRIDADGDVWQEDHRVKHVLICRRDRARSKDTRVRVIGEDARAAPRPRVIARLDGGEDVVVDRVRWHTEDDPCNACAALDGVTVRAGDNFPGVGTASPPLHPHCRCTLVIVDAAGNEYAEYTLIGDNTGPYAEYSVAGGDP